MALHMSVIIPVFDDLQAIKETITSLRRQAASESSFEIIVVDNGSTDGTVEWLKDQDDIIFLQEIENSNSPYSCRNRGYEVSTGDYLVFLDSTCVPSKSWIANSAFFAEHNPDCLFGGRVDFDWGNNKTAAKFYDSIKHIQIEKNIKEKKECQTANLWVPRSIFEKYGPFRESVRSGEDVRWTKYCTTRGISLLYAEKCTVYKSAREFKELMKKQIRIGKGQVIRWKSENRLLKKIILSFRYYLPMRPSYIRKKIEDSDGYEFGYCFILKVYGIDFCAHFFNTLGNFSGIVMMCLKLKEKDT